MPRRFNADKYTLNGKARDGGAKNEPAAYLPPSGKSPKPVAGENDDIAEQHEREVNAAVERLGTDDPERISEYLYLHVWIVKRHLGIRPEAALIPRGIDLVAAYLKQHGASTCKDIAAGIKRPHSAVSNVLNRTPARFKKAGTKPTGGMPAVLWGLVEEAK